MVSRSNGAPLLPDLDAVAAFIRETAQSIILPRFRTLAREEIREKKPGDLVTIADTEAEHRLEALLLAHRPGAAVVGEEAVAADGARMARLHEEAPVWVIDPIDGTGNFAKGQPGFAVIVAYVEAGATRAGWIYDPLGDRLVSGIAGEGAWSAGRRLEVSAAIAPAAMVGAAYGRAKSGQRSAEALRASGRVAAVANTGCSGLEYLSLVMGETQFSLHSRSLPWDHAAGMMLSREAGGVARFLDGSPYDPRIPDRPVLAAASDAGWNTVRDVVLG